MVMIVFILLPLGDYNFMKDMIESEHLSLSSEAARQRMEETLRANAARPLFTGTAVSILNSLSLTNYVRPILIEIRMKARSSGGSPACIHLVFSCARQCSLVPGFKVYAPSRYTEERERGIARCLVFVVCF